jgi:hypothetical protein
MTMRETSTSYRDPHRPLPVSLANRAGRLLERTGIRADLEEASLIAAARARTGLTDLGDPAFREPMRVLLTSLEQEARLNPVGRLMVRENMIRVLGNRLRFQEARRQHPELLEGELEPPIVIVGLQRTGTTLLHRLLAADPGLRVLASWEAVNPAPLGESGWRRWLPRSLSRQRRYDPRPPKNGRDPRVRAAEVAQLSLIFLAPDFFAVHPIEAREPEEDCLLFDYTFYSTVHEATLRVPTYSAWLEQQDLTGAYRYYRDLLVYLRWQLPVGRWLLKTPHHMENLRILLDLFPGVRIIQTHRDPVRSLASFCSMVAHGHGVFSDRVDPHEVGAHWSAKQQRMVDRCLAVRDQPRHERSFFDVAYRDLTADPIAEVRRIYRWLGRPLTPALEELMRTWIEANPQHKHGRHRYRLEDFGLDRATEERRFAGYRERFQIPWE